MTTTMPIATQSTKPLSRVERTKSFLKASLIKKWKSSKELFTRPLANFTNNHDNNNVKTSKKQFDTNIRSEKCLNGKVLDNLDEFERNFLLSAGQKILVRELRKNFEKPQSTSNISNVSRPMHHPNHTSNQNDKLVTVIVTNNSPLQMRNGKSTNKKYSDACVQTTENVYENIKSMTELDTKSPTKKNASIQSRHSFYNTYRTEYMPCQWQNNNHYASNISLISCGLSGQREKTLEKTINKYKNSMKSSSAVDLTSISSTVLLETKPSITSTINTSSTYHYQQQCERGREREQQEKPHYSSIINISHTKSSENLTASPIIVDCRCESDGINHPKKNTQLKQTHSMKCMNYVEQPIVRFRNTDDDTKSLNITKGGGSTISMQQYYLCDNRSQYLNSSYCQLNSKCSSEYGGSNISLFSVNMETPNNSESICHNHELSSICHKRSDNNSNSMTNSPVKHDGNNNMTTKTATTLGPMAMPATNLRKCFSINQIDLNLLKNELDEFIDRELRTTHFGKNTLAHRRLQLENSIKKVNLHLIALNIFRVHCVYLKKKKRTKANLFKS